MKSTFRRWLPAIARNRTQALLGLAGLAIIGGILAGAATQTASAAADVASASSATSPDPADPNQKVNADKAATDRAVADKAAAAKAAADKAAADKATADKAAADQAAAAAAAAAAKKNADHVSYDYKRQPNYYYCGPAATRIALTAHGKMLSQDQVAKLLGTTTNGTKSALDVTRVLNSQLGADRYHTREIQDSTAKPAQMDQLQSDIVTAINQGDVVVANIAGTVTDSGGRVHSYPGGHYLTVVGFTDQGRLAIIADPADPQDDGAYQLSTIKLANWIATRGYAY